MRVRSPAIKFHESWIFWWYLGLIGGAFNSKNFQNTIKYSQYDATEKANIKANVSASEFQLNDVISYTNPFTQWFKLDQSVALYCKFWTPENEVIADLA